MNWLAELELWLGRLGGLAGIGTLALALYGFWRGRSHASGRESGPATRFLRWPFLFMATALYAGICALLWYPLPIAFPAPARIALLLLGSLLFFPGLGLYLWGLHTLGRMFSASSGFGVRLFADHGLVTGGPYAFVRHPMYLAVILVGLGGLLLYKTWAMAFIALNMFGLVFRARHEEQALATEFGEEWEKYCRRVPAWMPHMLFSRSRKMRIV